MISFIDANVIIKAFTENTEKEQCRNVLRLPFVTNALSLIEAQHGIATIKKNKMYAAYCIKALFKTEGIIVPLDKNLLFESFKRQEKYQLSTFDLINYVTALKYNCSTFVSYDKDFDGLEIKRIEP